MIRHTDMGKTPFTRARRLYHEISAGRIVLGGNRRLKIYGRLDCRSGKRMNADNRVFFETEGEAITAGYRPCGHCMAQAYKLWKQQWL